MKFGVTGWDGQIGLNSSVITARVRSTREGNVLTRVCPSINLSVHRGGYPYPIMLCNISQNAMRQLGGVPGQVPPPGGGTRGGTRVRYPPGVPGSGTPLGGYPGQVPPGGGTRVRYPPGGSGTPPGGVPVPPWGGTRVRYPPRGVPGSGTPPGGVPGSGTPPGGVPGSGTPPGGGTRVGQQKEYSLHGGRYASCVHAEDCLVYSMCRVEASKSFDPSNKEYLQRKEKSTEDDEADHSKKS